MARFLNCHIHYTYDYNITHVTKLQHVYMSETIFSLKNNSFFLYLHTYSEYLIYYLPNWFFGRKSQNTTRSICVIWYLYM